MTEATSGECEVHPGHSGATNITVTKDPSTPDSGGVSAETIPACNGEVAYLSLAFTGVAMSIEKPGI